MQSTQTVTTDRLQGQDISVSADSGVVVVKDVYARQAAFKSRKGDIRLGNLHGDVQVSCGQGNVGIGEQPSCLISIKIKVRSKGKIV